MFTFFFFSVQFITKGLFGDLPLLSVTEKTLSAFKKGRKLTNSQIAHLWAKAKILLKETSFILLQFINYYKATTERKIINKLYIFTENVQ